MTDKQLKKHKCEGSVKFSVKEIPVFYCYEASDENGKVFIAHGLDGTFYKLVQTLHRPTDEFLQRKKSDKDFTEPQVATLIF
jgi:hypothetical protein